MMQFPVMALAICGLVGTLSPRMGWFSLALLCVVAMTVGP